MNDLVSKRVPLMCDSESQSHSINFVGLQQLQHCTDVGKTIACTRKACSQFAVNGAEEGSPQSPLQNFTVVPGKRLRFKSSSTSTFPKCMLLEVFIINCMVSNSSVVAGVPALGHWSKPIRRPCLHTHSPLLRQRRFRHFGP